MIGGQWSVAGASEETLRFQLISVRETYLAEFGIPLLGGLPLVKENSGQLRPLRDSRHESTAANCLLYSEGNIEDLIGNRWSELCTVLVDGKVRGNKAQGFY